jgi:hypothetical protein
MTAESARSSRRAHGDASFKSLAKICYNARMLIQRWLRKLKAWLRDLWIRWQWI